MSERRLDVTTQEWRIVTSAVAHDRDGCALCDVVDPDAAAPGPAVAVLDDPDAPLSGTDAHPDSRTIASRRVRAATGVAELVVQTGVHGRRFAEFEPAEVSLLVDVWADRFADLTSRPGIAYVFIYADCGGPADRFPGHAHGGIHAYSDVPPRPAQELRTSAAHLERTGRCVFCDVVAQELTDGLRVVAHNRHFLAYVPFAPRHQFEVHISAHRHATSLLDLTGPERASLGELLRTVAQAYDGVAAGDARWSMAIHQAPVDDGASLPVAHLHVEFVLVADPDGMHMDVGAVALGAGVSVHKLAPADAAARLRAALSG